MPTIEITYISIMPTLFLIYIYGKMGVSWSPSNIKKTTIILHGIEVQWQEI